MEISTGLYLFSAVAVLTPILFALDAWWYNKTRQQVVDALGETPQTSMELYQKYGFRIYTVLSELRKEEAVTWVEEPRDGGGTRNRYWLRH